LLKHGQSEGNIAPIFQALDSALTETGKKQAALVAERVSRLSFDTLISSPLSRARDTTEAIRRATNKVPEYSDLFVERVKPTRLSGKAHDDAEVNDLYKEWEKSLYTPGYRAEDAENFDDLVNRADRALNFLAERPEKELVVVTHGYFLRTIMLRIILGSSLTPENFKHFQTHTETENTGLSVVAYDQTYDGSNTNISWRLWVYNDYAHLV
jgi:probable phosphoglycerate mutase